MPFNWFTSRNPFIDSFVKGPFFDSNDESVFLPPPPPDENYLLQEDGFFLLQEDGSRILLESGPFPPPLESFLLQEDGNFLLQEDGSRILLSPIPVIHIDASLYINGQVLETINNITDFSNNAVQNTPSLQSTVTLNDNVLGFLFTGTQSYNFQSTATIPIDDQLTVVAVVTPTNLSVRSGIFTTRLPNNAGTWALEVGIASGGAITNSVSTTTPGVFTSIANNCLTLNQRVVIIYSKNKLLIQQIYINGINKTTSQNNTFTFGGISTKILANVNTAVTTQRFRGYIHELQIYSSYFGPEDALRITNDLIAKWDI